MTAPAATKAAPLHYLSVCSGIGAATQAWHPLGWQPVAFSEIEPFPSAVLAHHYPDVPNRGDMTKFQDWPDDTVDLLCGGTPCQSFSVAGLRQGLADPRGNLMLTYLAIAAKYRPRWLVWENVPGVYSANSHDAPDQRPPEIDLDGDSGPNIGEEIMVVDQYDADENHAFACFLAGLQELGYGFSYRTLDAQYVRTRGKPRAVPQRRRRVFVVGYLGDWRRAAAVLFDRESLSGRSAPRREAGQRPAPTISARPTGGGGLGTDFDLDGGLIANSGQVGYCLTASAQQSLDAETETETETLIAVAHALRGEGFDAGEDGTGRGTPIIAFSAKDHGGDAMENLSPTLRAGTHDGSHAAVRRLTPRECERLQGFPSIQKYGKINIWLDDKSPALADVETRCTTRPSSALIADESGSRQSAKNALPPLLTSRQNGEPPVALHVLIDFEREEVALHSAGKCLWSASTADRSSKSRLPMPPAGFAHAIARLMERAGATATLGKVGSPASTPHSITPESGSWCANVSGDEIEALVKSAVNGTAHQAPLTTSATSRSGPSSPNFEPSMETLCCSVVAAIASFIPIETRTANSYAVKIETVQGFTRIPYRGKPASDGPRYKALGNSWALNCIEWIGERIKKVDSWE